MIVLLIYIAIFIIAFVAVRFITQRMTAIHDFTSLKTVTFGDESAVRPNRWASVISVVSVFLIWGAFTGSSWTPIPCPGPFVGDTEFTYVLEAPDGSRDEATVYVRVFRVADKADGEGSRTRRRFRQERLDHRAGLALQADSDGQE